VSFRMSRRNLLAVGLSMALLPALGQHASAQANWPTKPIKLIVPYPVGGQTDLIARTYAEYLGKHLGSPSSWTTSQVPAASSARPK
jgi:tripartite-type tricarboxylate transporter receptor subunit TctC